MKNIKAKKKEKLEPIKERPDLLQQAMENSNEQVLAKVIQDMLKKDKQK